MSDFVQDLAYGLRSLRRAPAFAATAILTLALGIGLSTAVFTVAEAVLLRGLPMREQDRLVTLWGQSPDRSLDNFPVRLRFGRDFARESRTLERVAFYGYEGAWPVATRDGDRTAALRRALVSGEFFDVLGARPVLGRGLTPDDDRAGSAPVAVLSHGAWRRAFGGDPNVVGRRIVLHQEGKAHTIVGVMPRGLDFPRGVEMWAAFTPARTVPGTDSMTVSDVDMVARLAPGRTAGNARDELTAFFGRSDAPELRVFRGVVNPLPRLILGETRPAIIAFAAAAALLLLITCINVANLLLVRGLARGRETAVRAALGAGRGRIVAQLLTENAALAAVGGALGILLAVAAVRGFVAVAPAALPRLDEIGVNGAALAGAVAITVVAMLLFGLAPAVTTSRVDLQATLRSDARQSPARRSRMAAEGLVAGQVALALLVFAAAGLIARSLVALEGAEMAFDPSRLVIGELAIRADRFDTREKQIALVDRVLEAVEAVPGVRAATPTVAVPYAGTGGWDGRLQAEGQAPGDAKANPMLNMEVVDPGYFSTLGIAAVRGRLLGDADRQGAPMAVLLSESAARHYWPNGDPIGKRLSWGPQGPWFTVVGVVPDTRYRDLRTARPSIYWALRQSFFPFASTVLVVRADGAGEPAALAPAIRRAVEAVDPGVTLSRVEPFETHLDQSLAQLRLNALLLGVFALAAVALAAVGLFGVMSTMVRRRAREMGVRLALGATAGELARMVVRRGLAIAAAGLVVGLAGAMLANRLVAAMLYETSPTDAGTLAAVAGVLMGVAAVATLLPARATTRIDPASALRAEG